jgi:hypothetical protein
MLLYPKSSLAVWQSPFGIDEKALNTDYTMLVNSPRELEMPKHTLQLLATDRAAKLPA